MTKREKWINKWTNQSRNKRERESEQLLEKHTQWPSSWIPFPFSESHPLPVFNIYFSLFLIPSAINSSVSVSFAHLILWTVVGRWWFEWHHFHSHPSCCRKLVLTQVQTDHHDPPSVFSPYLAVRSDLQVTIKVDYPINKVRYHNFYLW